jgi:hypothetical protein
LLPNQQKSGYKSFILNCRSVAHIFRIREALSAGET